MEQIERTRRYLKRLRDIYREVPYTVDTRDYYLDDVYSFFIHCYHIKDWIVHLNILGLTEKDVASFVNSHTELRICADLANGTKHCHLKSKFRARRQPHVAAWTFSSDGVNDELKTTRGQFSILYGRKFYDALELAERCMELWDRYVEDLAQKVDKP